jgi:NADPH-dependent curcumin reductase CurA
VTNVRVLLAQRPGSSVDETCFAFDEQEIGDPGPGEVLVRNLYLSCDPYLRLEMNTRFALGQPVTARAVGHIVRSADPQWPAGALVWGFFGWEQYSIVATSALHAVDPADGPASHAIGVRGMNGLTAWAGVIDLGRPRPGDTVVVSAATGAVGSISGQLARLAGARVVAVAGGQTKTRHALDVLGYDAAVDHRAAESLAAALAAACPDGIDVYFDNVGGPVLQAVLPLMRPRSRLAMCGVVSRYDGAAVDQPDLSALMGAGATATWFSVHHYMDRLPEVADRLGTLVASGQLVYVEDVSDGIESVPTAFLRLFRGDNLGKTLVRLGDPDSPHG